MPNTTQAKEPSPKPRRRIRYLRLASICVGVFVLGLVFIQWWKPGLNATERRFLGVWTWQDKPGEMTCHYLEDSTMYYTVGLNDTSANFMKWKVDANVISLQDLELNPLKLVVKNVLSRFKQKPDQYPVRFSADGNITFEMPDGSEKILIPWSSDQGEFLKQSE